MSYIRIFIFISISISIFTLEKDKIKFIKISLRSLLSNYFFILA